ncbi:MAG: antibiotic biosynthesis monooxygenase [Gammaproteobacteria bacterium]
MIARTWHGMTSTSRADDYLAFLESHALPDYRSIPGNIAAYILRRVDGDTTHFTTLTFWSSHQAIEAFAGTDISRAKYYPEDKDFLLEFVSTVEHSGVYS